MWQDLRLAVRALRATPIVTNVIILSLAMGIGANTVIFSLVDALLLRRLLVKDPDRLALLANGMSRRWCSAPSPRCGSPAPRVWTG